MIKPKFLIGVNQDIDLDSAEGEKDYLISLIDTTAHRLDYNSDERAKLKEELESLDYNKMILRIDVSFGNFFTFYTNDEELLKAFGTPYELECNK